MRAPEKEYIYIYISFVFLENMYVLLRFCHLLDVTAEILYISIGHHIHGETTIGDQS
jgi:hypothetical protein